MADEENLNYQIIHLLVVGNLKSEEYHKADYVVKILADEYPDSYTKDDSKGWMEFQWTEHKKQLKSNWALANDVEKTVLGSMADVVIYSQGHLGWSWTTFLNWITATYPALDITTALQSIDFTKKAFQAYSDYLSNEKFSYAYIDISLNGKTIGQVSLELYKEICPNTSANFLALCTGEKGEGDEGRVRLWYISSPIHRIVRNGWIQGGDICSGKGDEGFSIYGHTFPDECFAVPHDSRGVLGMANHGRNTNNSQFYITLAPASWMDKRYVAFGQVIEGSDVLDKLEKVETYNERPQQECIISSCGQLTIDTGQDYPLCTVDDSI